jgi:G3E family GTPase
MAVVVEAAHGRLPMTLLLPEDPQRLVPRPGFEGPLRPGVGRPGPMQPGAGRPGAARRSPVADRFETLSWTCDRPLSLPRLQAAIGRLAPRLARAKGLFETAEQPGREMVFQLAGGRAILSPTGKTAGPRDGAGPAEERPATPLVRMVFIAEIGVLSAAELEGVMAGCAV